MLKSRVDWTDSRTPHATSTVPTEKPETLRVLIRRCNAFRCKCEIIAIRGGVSDASRLAVYQTLSIEYPSIFFWPMLCVIVPFLFYFAFCFYFHALVGASFL